MSTGNAFSGEALAMQVTLLDTRFVDPAERFDLFYETVTRRVMPMTPRCAPCARDFPARMLAARRGARGAMLIEAPGHYVQRGGAEIRAGDPATVYLGCMLGGSRWLLNTAGERRLRRGDLFLTCSARPFALDGGRGRYAGVTLAVPRGELTEPDLARLRDPRAFDALVTRDLLRQTLVRVADALENQAPGEIPFLSSVALGALELGLSRARDDEACEGEPAVRGELVRMEIARNIGNSDVTAERVAVQLGVSVRSLQRALAREDLSFRSMLRDQRMEAAYQALVTTSRSIDRIAASCGYAELSSFYRAFRRQFARTPAEVRVQGRRSDASTALGASVDTSLRAPRRSG
jgi:AraC-like DNA-binding protein